MCVCVCVCVGLGRALKTHTDTHHPAKRLGITRVLSRRCTVPLFFLFFFFQLVYTLTNRVYANSNLHFMTM